MADSALSSELSGLSMNTNVSSGRTISTTLTNARAVAHKAGKKLDETFYFQDAYFEVQDTIFKVHRRGFEESSPIFRDMFAVAKEDETLGLDPSNPIQLEGITIDQFKQLLSVMYHLHPDPNQPKPKPTLKSSKSSSSGTTKLTATQWISVLRLSTMWQMDLYREMAIAALSELPYSLPPAPRVYLAMRYNVETWFVPALVQLAQRPKPMGREEYQLLDADCLMKICKVRERFSRHCTSCSCLSGCFSLFL
ncbi:hypothetical protein BDY19DRAFT_928580 [Irpex rosettiformis]|uniref:Uncharacterized protein n=1 Tax=Irpex rosettiformis TaxID=378272 RepID=A0ACB8UDX6_9APHY|nr:hypothetical protein BDY19DRAFT_928580 [Irpex rosettiformis]